jgi:hypothetical protein
MVGRTADIVGERKIVGAELAAFLPLDGGVPTVVAVDSNGRMVMLNESAETTAEFLPQQNEIWRAPLTTAPDGGFTAVKWLGQAGYRLVHFDGHGAIVNEYPVEIPAVFSGKEADGIVLLISRLTKRLQFTDLRNGTSVVMALSHDRPRAGVQLATGRWAIIHDTDPDIGISLIRNGQEEGFVPYDDWYSAITETSVGGAVAVSFNGTISTLSPGGGVSRRQATEFEGLLHVHPGFQGRVWVTSENQGRSYRLNSDNTADVDARYWKPGLQAVAEFSGTNLLLATSARRLEYLAEQR